MSQNTKPINYYLILLAIVSIVSTPVAFFILLLSGLGNVSAETAAFLDATIYLIPLLLLVSSVVSILNIRSSILDLHPLVKMLFFLDIIILLIILFLLGVLTFF